MSNLEFSEILNDSKNDKERQAAMTERQKIKIETLETVITILNETANAYMATIEPSLQSVSYRHGRQLRGETFRDAAHKVQVLLSQVRRGEA